jgi:regulator of replication initiation timing
MDMDKEQLFDAAKMLKKAKNRAEKKIEKVEERLVILSKEKNKLSKENKKLLDSAQQQERLEQENAETIEFFEEEQE